MGDLESTTFNRVRVNRSFNNGPENRPKITPSTRQRWVDNQQSAAEWSDRFRARPVKDIVCIHQHGSQRAVMAHVHTRRPDPGTGRTKLFPVDLTTGRWIRPEAKP